MLARNQDVTGDDAVRAGITAQLPALRSYAVSLARDVTRAEDLVQQVVLKALASSRQFTSGTNLAAWLFTIMKNTHRSEWRKRKRVIEWSDGYANDLRFVSGDADGADAGIDVKIVLRALACVSAAHRDAVIAVCYCGMPYEDAAAALGVPIGTIKSRVNRGREALLGLLDGYQVDEAEAERTVSDIVSRAREVPPADPLYPIARAYVDLYEPLLGDRPPQASELDAAWASIVSSGALNEPQEGWA